MLWMPLMRLARIVEKPILELEMHKEAVSRTPSGFFVHLGSLFEILNC